MLSIRPLNYAHSILLLLSMAGEIPTTTLPMLGNVRAVKAILRKMETPQRILLNGEVFSERLRLIQVSGKGNLKTIRLTRKALPILPCIHPDALEFYLGTFYNHKFPGTRSHIWRHHRVAEALAMFMAADIEIRQYVLPKLQRTNIKQVVSVVPSFYTSRSIKALDALDLNKTIFTRVVGALFTEDSVYAVYNTRDAVMRWSGLGEFKTLHHLTEIARMNAGVTDIDSAILFGRDPDIALATLLDSDKTRRKEMRFDSIYHHIHYIPMTDSGKTIIKLLTRLDWREALLSAVFPEEMRIRGHTFMELDAISDGTHILCHLDSDLARLIRFREAAATRPDLRFEVIAFPWQADFLRAYLEPEISIKILDESALANAIEI